MTREEKKITKVLDLISIYYHFHKNYSLPYLDFKKDNNNIATAYLKFDTLNGQLNLN